MKNNALIFINKKLGVINYELSAKLEQSKLLYRSFCQISRSTVLTDDDAMLNADDIKTEMKEILKTLLSEYEMRYDKVFNSVDNKKIQKKLVPELLRSLQSPSYLKLKKWFYALHKH
ncbi:2691_t:CDS:2 [Funneliformis geosporum]|uniref:2691_t:CDS:1 n=1 Tax=Funneliformis geosporum TaxID=1117311 RepID=A0A9W4SRU9_9GLOM|nr:2691_t:CDS:2 [Funneliformis geosporum]